MSGSIGTLDVNAIVSALMERQQTQLNRLQAQAKDDNVKLSLYGQLQNLVNNLNTAVQGVNTAFNTIAYAASVGNSSVLSASIASNSNVYAGTHTIVVSNLASVQTDSSATTYATRDAALGLSGTLTFTIGSNNFTVNVTASDTLDTIRDGINQAADNVGITASVMTTTGGGGDVYTLMLASNNTGTANAFTVSGTLASSFNTVVNAAQDAHFTLDSNNVVRGTNNISDVMDGITFNLLGTGTSSLTISHDNTAQTTSVTNAIQGMVNSYNTIMDYIAQNVASGNILQDSSVNTIKNNLVNAFRSVFSNVGGLTGINDLGISLAASSSSTTSTGISYTNNDLLTLDTTKLNSLLMANPGEVKSFFTTATTGFSAVINTSVQGITDFGGTISTIEQWLNKDVSTVQQNIINEQNRLDDMRTFLVAKYSKLQTVLDSYDRLGTMLDGIFSKMNISSSKK